MPWYIVHTTQTEITHVLAFYFLLLFVSCWLRTQGPETDMSKVADLCKLSQKGYAASMVVTNHNKKVSQLLN